MLRDTHPAILIVEDEPFIRMAAADIVADIGATPFEAADAGEALAILGEHPEIGLLFTDVDMRGMDGVTLARRVREIRPGIPVIVTSALRTVGEADLPEDGAFLPKPYGSAQLASAVERTLAAVAP